MKKTLFTTLLVASLAVSGHVLAAKKTPGKVNSIVLSCAGNDVKVGAKPQDIFKWCGKPTSDRTRKGKQFLSYTLKKQGVKLKLQVSQDKLSKIQFEQV